MEEIEVKILDIDKDAVVKKLLILGAKKVFEGPMNSIYFELEDYKKKMLRVRQKGDICLVTVKVRKEDSEIVVSDEYEIEVSSFEETRKIFRALGFKEYSSNFRKRESYKIKNSLVEIDMYDDIPPFLEVESPSKEEVKEIVELLGFSFSQTSTLIGDEVKEVYGK